MFNCFRLRKQNQTCEPKIAGETPVTNNLPSESRMDQIRYKAMCERSIMWYCSNGLMSSFCGMEMAPLQNTIS